jgi:putative SOS response-associated peptidase YedK
MCGRYNISKLKKFLEIHRWIQGTVNFDPHYNAAPTQMLPVVTSSKIIELYKWGLIPHWAKDPAIGSRMINARAETLAEKPAFKKLLATQRCLVPANVFYEWEKAGKQKIPHYIAMANDEPFAFAGLWDTWRGPDGITNSFTIITTTPNPLVATIHDRMPVILPNDHYGAWLVAPSALGPYPAGEMTARIVSTLVNSPRNNTPDILIT